MPSLSTTPVRDSVHRLRSSSASHCHFCRHNQITRRSPCASLQKPSSLSECAPRHPCFAFLSLSGTLQAATTTHYNPSLILPHRHRRLLPHVRPHIISPAFVVATPHHLRLKPPLAHRGRAAWLLLALSYSLAPSASPCIDALTSVYIVSVCTLCIPAFCNRLCFLRSQTLDCMARFDISMFHHGRTASIAS